MVTKFPIVHCFLRLFSQFEIKSLSIAVFSLRKCCETNLVKVQMLTGSIMIVKNATLCWPTRVTSYIFISRSFPSSSTILVLEYIELSIISNMLFFYKFSSSMEIVVLLILFRQHFFFYFILGTMYLVLSDHCTTKLKMMIWKKASQH